MYSIFRDTVIFRDMLISNTAVSWISLSYSGNKMFFGQVVGLAESAESAFTKEFYS